MKLRKIHAENYKTYKTLDLNLEVTEDRPIILIGGANGCGKTTLFDAIYHALYGLEIKNARQFEELLNAGIRNKNGVYNQTISLEISFSGMVLNREQQYQLIRQYRLSEDGRVLEVVKLNMGGNQFTYGSGSTAKQRADNEEAINKIITGNLPAELSNYFLFDAMKTSELVKEEAINKLIVKNINSVMGFSKYEQLQKAAQTLLDEKKAERLENENQRKDYQNLVQEKTNKERELDVLSQSYTSQLNYANDNKEQYEQLKEGKNADEVTRDKINKLEDSLKSYAHREKEYRQSADGLLKDLETSVVYPKLAAAIKTQVDVVLDAKQRVVASKENVPNDIQIEAVTKHLVKLIEEQYLPSGTIDLKRLLQDIKNQQEQDIVEDKFAYLNNADVDVLRKLVQGSYVNPFLQLDDMRESLNNELMELPQRREQLEDYRRTLNGSDYSFIDKYEHNAKALEQTNLKMSSLKDEITELKKKISRYDYDIPQVPDPQYDMLCKLPEFFRNLGARLLRAKKANIERMMREQLNINLVVYAGVIGKVELSSDNSDDISFKIFHQDGNEIFLNQLNAGAKQTVMQVLLKVLYSLGDYEPPVMIDTVMGVLDKESRNVILERYFPDLAKQTILLSTDTEITTEHDFTKLQAYVAHTYTLHRDKLNQCTEISNDYFGLKTHNL